MSGDLKFYCLQLKNQVELAKVSLFFPSGDDILANFSNEEGSHWNKGVSSSLRTVERVIQGGDLNTIHDKYYGLRICMGFEIDGMILILWVRFR